MSARTTLVQTIRDIVGDDAVVIDVEDNGDSLGKVTVMVKQRSIAKIPEAPRAGLAVEFVVSVTHPGVDPAVSEPGLDDFVPSLLAELNAFNWFRWEDATKVADGQNLGYDIDCMVLAGPRNEGREDAP